MVQIIQSGPSQATLRQQAMDNALQGMVQGYAGYEAKKQADLLTQRQQALADNQTKLKLMDMGVANPDQALAQLKGEYKQTEVTPAQPAQYGQELAGPVMPGQSPLREMLSAPVPAQMSPANPLGVYTEAKQAEINAKNEKMMADKQAAAVNIANKQADTIKKEAETKFIRENKAGLVQSQIDKNEKWKPSGGADTSQKDLENFRKAHDPSVASSRSPIGKEYSKFQQAQHALNLVAEFGDNLDAVTPMKKRELAVTLATMLSPGLPHESTIAHLDEGTLNSYLAGKIQAITGRPAGSNSAGMVKQLKDSVIAQAEVSKQNIKRYQGGVEASYAGKIQANPDLYNSIMQNTRVADTQPVHNASAGNAGGSPWLKYGAKK